MDHEQNDQLLSAYLDGELNADERAQVEQLLATSAEARELVDELKAIRAGLQGLPRHQLEPDFAQQVLRRAEQAKSSAAPSESKAAILPQHDPWQPSIFRSRRGIAWSLVAVAAAVIIMVATRNDEHGDRQIARQPANAPAPQAQTVRALTVENKVAQQETPARDEEQLQPGAAPEGSLDKKESPAETSQNATADSVIQMQSGAATARSNDGVESFGGAAQSRSGGELSTVPAAAPPPVSESNPVLIVQVGLKQQPAAGDEFAQVLARNRIALKSGREAARDELDRSQEPLALRAAPCAGFDVVYVEVHPQELSGILKELKDSNLILSMGTSASAPLPSADKDAVPSSHAERFDALDDWVAQHLNDLPQTIAPSAESAHDNARAETKLGDAAARSLTAPARGPATPGTAQLHLKKSLSAESNAEAAKVNPPPLVRAVFVIRSVDSAASASSAAKAAPAEQSAPAAGQSPGAAEKQ